MNKKYLFKASPPPPPPPLYITEVQHYKNKNLPCHLLKLKINHLLI